MREASKIP
ncbi:hypothetical protein YPPY46_1825, partial [Yersinia pestis PY-46]